MVFDSWLPVPQDSGFTLENLPFGCFARPEGSGESAAESSASGRPRVGVRVGKHVVDLTALQQAGYLQDLPGPGSRAELQSCYQHVSGLALQPSCATVPLGALESPPTPFCPTKRGIP